jgi:hypothetical protein
MKQPKARPARSATGMQVPSVCAPSGMLIAAIAASVTRSLGALGHARRAPHSRIVRFATFPL